VNMIKEKAISFVGACLFVLFLAQFLNISTTTGCACLTLEEIKKAEAKGVYASLDSAPTPIPTSHELDSIPTPPKTSELPQPSYIPKLRPYHIDKSHDIWMAENPSSYVIPDNDWVKYYASQLYVDADGRIRYKNRPIPLLADEKGKVIMWTDEPFLNNYTYDWEKYGNGAKGSLANDDYWDNPDYYLTHGMKGDCDEWALAVVSMMLSGEMSVKKGDDYV